jgi:predicted dehydrogenase
MSSGRTAATIREPRPSLGFVGVGWIGRNRMEAIALDARVEVTGVVEPAEDLALQALEVSPAAEWFPSYEALLDTRPDGIVIATPSALHAEQALQALERGIAVFCQKPLGRTAHEARRVVEAARRADLLLGVDLSYRHTAALREVRRIVASGELGRIFAAELVFHNAWGPDKPWFYDPTLSGGGCVIDLGIHLVDMLEWVLSPERIVEVQSRLHVAGEHMQPSETAASVEDFAAVLLTTSEGVSARLACSWNLHAGKDAVIEASFYGTAGGVTMTNVDGSFYEFCVDRHDRTHCTRIVSPPDEWSGRAAVAWARDLADGHRFDAGIESAVKVAETIDRIYGRSE